ncbi:DUF1631 family protein [Pelomonas sp. V22]|uniref:DUF1631 family protein n=1 Tax=Pelomonas sp. V22 TaxID=2822139 RepID=UPI0024A977CB|nr:DUF1631 family protein [Pelomonas sp. V22]MDI4635260.1 DUF1631 family protein [Pelomonas sp. V22]
MNPPDLRLNPHLEAALQRIRTAAEQAAERGAEGMGLSALSASQTKRRDELLAAQFLFRKQQVVFGQHFYQSLRKQLAAARSPEMAAAPAPKKKDWTELSLMGDEQVESMVQADRIGMAIGHQSEWELREVDSYISSLSGNDRNPLRPEVIAQGLLDGVNAVTDDAAVRQVLTDELTRALSQEMRACYADIAELFRSRGLRPQDLRVRAGVDPHGHSGRGAGPNSEQGALDVPDAGPSGRGGWGGPRGGGQTGYGNSMHGGLGGQPGGSGRRGVGMGGFGTVDVQMMDLLRRLAQVPSGHGKLGGDYSSSWADEYSDGHWNAGGGGMPLPPNLIVQHREELRQASTGNLDHMVIDVVGSLFDQILSDPKVPPQMARLIARLQLPVLRVALGDNSFFSSRKHPVRRFVNRIASLACAFDDFSEDPGKAFLSHVRDLVQDVANGDFDRMDVYESKLDALEQFIGEQAAASLQAQNDATLLVARKETDLRLQQRYMQQLQQQLAPVPMHDFLRDFLAQVWSQAIVLAARDDKQPERAQRLRQLGRQLVMSVQPKAGSEARKSFLAELPGLMKTLNEGLDLIQWPEAARKPFFGQLLPAHAESLKVAALTALDYNLLAKQLDQVFGVAPPEEKDLPAASAPVELPEDLDLGARLSTAEAQRIGLVDETKVDWSGQVDIELGAEEAPLQAVDISIEGLPAVEDEPDPSTGALLIDHLQLGFAYNMLTGDDWHKVRLAHISAGRSFFIFTEGSKHQQTVTMTARMLKRLCESGRLRAFENAYLLERATARARKQLAALSKA